MSNVSYIGNFTTTDSNYNINYVIKKYNQIHPYLLSPVFICCWVEEVRKNSNSWPHFSSKHITILVLQKIEKTTYYPGVP